MNSIIRNEVTRYVCAGDDSLSEEDPGLEFEFWLTTNASY